METLEQVQKASRERLYPSVTNPNWLVLRKRRELFRRWLNGSVNANSTILDLGGRIQPYRSLIASVPVRYLSVDLRPTPLVNVIADAEQLPLPSEMFDVVLCTQVMEYTAHPQQAVSEIYRILKPGGWLLASLPAVFPRDADEDRWRFLPAGIRQLLSSFSEVEVVPEGGSIVGFFRTVNVYLHLFAKYPVFRRLLSYTITPALNVLGCGLDEAVRGRNDTFAVNYSVLARK